MASSFKGPNRRGSLFPPFGPELTQYGVPNPCSFNPTLELRDGTGALIASNDNWQQTIIGGIITSDQARDIRNSGHVPGDGTGICDHSRAASRQLHGDLTRQTTRWALLWLKVYDLSPESNSILGNVSTRSFVQTKDDVMIGGFIIQGTQPKRVILRAIGPELTPYVLNVLPDPTLELHDGTGALIASNDNWLQTIIGGISPAIRCAISGYIGHAPRSPRESAILATLPSGDYTAIVRGANNTTGVALVEVYDLNPTVP